MEAARDVGGGYKIEECLVLRGAGEAKALSEVGVEIYREWQAGQPLFLTAFLPAVHRLGLDDLPRFVVVLEAAAGDPGQELFADHHGSKPICESIIRFNWQPREFSAHSLVANLAVRITSILPLHTVFPRFCT
jgi:hypothetical protein